MIPAKAFLGGRQLALVVLQAAHAALLIAVQPGAHDILATSVDLCDLRHAVTTISEQHHLGAQRDPAHRLSAESLEFLALDRVQMHSNHPPGLLLAEAARTMPIFWSCA
jgi:hypothetical protein